jgi:hypothetical protein
LKILKTRNFLIAAGIGLAGWYFFRRVSFGRRIKLIFRKIRLIGKGLSKQIELNFRIQNPTGQTGTISALTGEVLVNDRIVADFSSFGEQKIAPKSESDFKVIASPTIGILQLLTQKGLLQKGINYKIKGTGNFDGIVAPFEYNAKLF